MKKANNILLKALAVLLLTGAIMKGWQLLTEPMSNKDIWTNRAFLILTVEFEIALGIWLLSGLFKKGAWLAAITCFSLFSFITLYKALTGAESCGCFGSAHVNPWITLLAIDLPAVALLSIFRPKDTKLFDWPSIPRFATTFCLGLAILGITTPVLALNEPAKVTAGYEVLEPETWIGKKLPILKYIDVGKQLRRGNWIVLFFHSGCPDCVETIPIYAQMSRNFTNNEDSLRMALIEVPPYGKRMVSAISRCTQGRLVDAKDWFVTTPTVALLANGEVTSVWEGEVPDFETILDNITIRTNVRTGKSMVTEGRILACKKGGVCICNKLF